MAVVGTSIGVIIAAPCCILAAQNITPSRLLYTPMRWFLNTLRGINSFIFALLFVAAVGLGPFAGVLGIGLHSAGTIAKLWSEAIEAVEPGPLEAAALTGANRLKVISYALLPDILPNLTSITLYVWEFNVRSFDRAGVVGAGGIGQELKNSVDQEDRIRIDQHPFKFVNLCAGASLTEWSGVVLLSFKRIVHRREDLKLPSLSLTSPINMYTDVG